MTATSDTDNRVFRYGTPQQLAPSRLLKAGAMTARLEGGALRGVSLGPLELIRQIDFPVRDENWASLPPTVLGQTCEETADGFRVEHHFEVADGALDCRVIYTATRDGALTAQGTATAKRDFITNRTGFSLLHPLQHFAGHPVSVRHSGGGVSQTEMPKLIKPSQPIKDIAGLRFDIDGVTLDLGFEGEVFEMEDQRNWSDASYKTYCRPLVEPFAYTIKAGETLRQAIHVSVTGAPRDVRAKADESMTFDAFDPSPLPQLSLALQDGWSAQGADLDVLRKSGARHFLLRVTPDDAAALIPQAAAHAAALGAKVGFEIVLDDKTPAAAQLDRIAEICSATNLWPSDVVALPHAFLASYQPSSVWPVGLQPAACIAAARAAFPNARIGAGMLTNFTELNRCQPDGAGHDFITHGNSATVHAADDASVMQTIETLPHIFRSARAIAGGGGYRLGLTAIGMRTNPYGASTSPNPDQTRLTMTVWDPRARALFGAAWAVGALAATQDMQVEAIALAAPVGPFGIVSTASDVARPWYDEHAGARVYPLFHVFKALSVNGRRVSVQNLPDGVAAVAVKTQTGTRLVLSNLTDTPRALPLPEGRFACLSEDSFSAAACDADWLDAAWEPAPPAPHTLPPYAVLLGDLRDGS